MSDVTRPTSDTDESAKIRRPGTEASGAVVGTADGNQPGAPPPDTDSDERLKSESALASLMKRPELGAIAGVILVTVFFLITADSAMFTLAGFMNFMSPAAQLGILAIGAALLMIGGEFDLSLGSMIAFTGLFFGACVVTFGLPLILAIPATLLFAAMVGAINGQIVIRTGLPSFIVTLAFLFIYRGLSLVGLKWATGGSTQLRGVREATEDDFLTPIFSGDAFPGLFAALADGEHYGDPRLAAEPALFDEGTVAGFMGGNFARLVIEADERVLAAHDA